MPTGGSLRAQAEGPARELKLVHHHEQIGGRIEGGVGAERRQRRAAPIHVRRGFEDAHGDAVHAALAHAGALAAAEGGNPPARDEGVGEPEPHVVPRRRVFRTGIAEADDGTQGSALFAALGLLGFLGFLALLPFGRSRAAAGLRLGLGGPSPPPPPPPSPPPPPPGRPLFPPPPPALPDELRPRAPPPRPRRRRRGLFAAGPPPG